MSLLEFARGPALEWSVFVFVVGVLWRLLSVLLLRGKRDLSEPRRPAAWTRAAVCTTCVTPRSASPHSVTGPTSPTAA